MNKKIQKELFIAQMCQGLSPTGIARLEEYYKPTHPIEVLVEEFLKPLNQSQEDFS